MRGLLFLLLSAILAGCGSSWSVRDEDGDGKSILEGDCWDNPIGGADVGPDAAETWYDGIDENCDGLDDFDKDGDGYPSADYPGGTDCWDDPDVVPDGFEAINGFPALTAGAVHPGADDIFYDAVDANCDAASDFDQDGDGYDTSNADYRQRDGSLGDDCYDDATVDAYPESGVVTTEFDPADVNPGATDTWYDGTDANCDAQNDYDQDGDGYTIDHECDDTNAAVFPNPDVVEIWYNDVDENCDGNLYDKDLDGHASADYGGDDCWDDYDVVPTGFDAINGLPQPTASMVYPGAAVDAPYDGVDGDCAGDSDFDADGDGIATEELPDRLGAYGTDCDDDNADTYPGADDTWYDGIDSDCAGDSDYDADGDGFDSESEISTGTDCDDSRVAVNPDANEVCGTSYDDNCDGATDLQDATGCTDWYYDGDGDHYGTTTSQCWCNAQAATNYDASNTTDCNDASAGINPVATEVCDASNTDEDCDGAADNNDASAASAGKTRYYHDSDRDGFGDIDHAGSLYCDDPSTSSQAWVTDNTDCDDAEATTYPGAVESIADGVDQDCDGGDTCYVDADSDSYRSMTTTATVLSADLDCDDAGEGSATEPATDCDDTVAGTHPGATEVVADGVDQNCNGGETCYADADSDGYRSTSTATTVSSADLDCDDAGEGSASELATDCNDAVAAINPGATEICDSANTDEDCDGLADNNDSSASSTGKTRYYPDADSDTYGDSSNAGTLYCDLPSSAWTTDHTDCNDASAVISPAATEICDAANTDEDCDGVADNNDTSASTGTKTRYYPDADGDLYGDDTSSGTLYCDAPSSAYTTDHTDCNDASSGISPGDTEICDSANTDEDCDGLADNNDTSASSATKTRYYPDLDGDTYGDSSSAGTLYCDLPSSAWTTVHTDCDDTSAAISPAATEVCDAANTDEDCDGLADNNDSSASSSGKTRYYPDADGDTYGDDGSTGTLYCDLPSSAYTTDHTDCDDTSAAISPADTEICDSGNTDEDCDGLSDDADPSVSSSGKTRYYPDADVDTFGDSSSSGTLYCDDPTTSGAHWVLTHTDCNDGSAVINTSATEVCDASNTDEDCDGLADNDDSSASSATKTTYYPDADGDTYGASSSAGTLYCDAPSSAYVTSHTDCDDAVATTYVGATETCNSVDDDCDGAVDDGLTLYYADADGDGHGSDSATGTCTSGGGAVTNNNDCDDTLATVYTGASEICDGIQNDCTGSWTSASENQEVSYETTGGVWSDISTSFTGTTASAYSLASSGTYRFCAGTYYTRLVGSGDTVTIEGVYGAATTTLRVDDAASTGAVLSVTNGAVSVSGITFSHGKGTSGLGGGVVASASSLPSVTPTVTLTDCVVADNTTTTGGGGIAVNSAAWVSLDTTVVQGNASVDGGGIYVSASAELTATDADISTNSASGNGAGIYVASGGGTVTLDGTDVYSNTASGDGGGLYAADATVTLLDTLLYLNTATGSGGGVYLDTGDATCTATGASLGGIYGNVAAVGGGGVMLGTNNAGIFTSDQCDFGTGGDDNTPDDVEIESGVNVTYTSFGSAESFTCDNTSAADCH